MAQRSTATKKAIAEYRRLVAEQSHMPIDQQWLMAKEISAAKAKAYVEMEYDGFGLRA